MTEERKKSSKKRSLELVGKYSKLKKWPSLREAIDYHLQGAVEEEEEEMAVEVGPKLLWTLQHPTQLLVMQHSTLPSGDCLITTHYYKSDQLGIKQWSVLAGRRIPILRQEEHDSACEVLTLIFIPHRRVYVCMCKDLTLRVCALTKFAQIFSVQLRYTIFCLQYNKEDDELYGGRIGMIEQWEIRGSEHSVTLAPKRQFCKDIGKEQWVTEVEVDNREGLLYVMTAEKILFISIKTKEVVGQYLSRHDGPLQCWCIYRQNDFLITGGADGKLMVFNKTSLNLIRVMLAHRGPVKCLEPHPDKQMVISGGDDNTIRFWNLDTLTVFWLIRVDGKLYNLHMLDSNLFYYRTRKTIFIYSLNQFYQQYASIESVPIRLMRCPRTDGPDRILTASEDGSVRVFSPTSGATLALIYPMASFQVFSQFAYDVSKDRLHTIIAEGKVLIFSTKTNPSQALEVWVPSCTEEEIYSILGMTVEYQYQCRTESEALVLAGLSCGQLIMYESEICTMRSPVKAHEGPVIKLEACRQLDEGTLGVKVTTSRFVSVGMDGFIIIWGIGVVYRSGVYRIKVVEEIKANLVSIPSHLCMWDDLICMTVYTDTELGPKWCLVMYQLTDVTSDHTDVGLWPELAHSSCEDHSMEVTALDVCPGMGLILTAGMDGHVKVWSCENFMLREMYFNESIQAACFANDQADILFGLGKHVCCVSLDVFLPVKELREIQQKIEAIDLKDDEPERPPHFNYNYQPGVNISLLTQNYISKLAPAITRGRASTGLTEGRTSSSLQGSVSSEVEAQNKLLYAQQFAKKYMYWLRLKRTIEKKYKKLWRAVTIWKTTPEKERKILKRPGSTGLKKKKKVEDPDNESSESFDEDLDELEAVTEIGPLTVFEPDTQALLAETLRLPTPVEPMLFGTHTLKQLREKEVMKRTPIIAPDGYIPNSVIRKSMKPIKPPDLPVRRPFKLKPVPQLLPQHLPRGWGTEEVRGSTATYTPKSSWADTPTPEVRSTVQSVEISDEIQGTPSDLSERVPKRKSATPTLKLISPSMLVLTPTGPRIGEANSARSRISSAESVVSQKVALSKVEVDKKGRLTKVVDLTELAVDEDSSMIQLKPSGRRTRARDKELLERLVEEPWFPSIPEGFDLSDCLDRLLQMMEKSIKLLDQFTFGSTCEYLTAIEKQMGMSESYLTRAISLLGMGLDQESEEMQLTSLQTLEQLGHCRADIITLLLPKLMAKSEALRKYAKDAILRITGASNKDELLVKLEELGITDGVYRSKSDEEWTLQQLLAAFDEEEDPEYFARVEQWVADSSPGVYDKEDEDPSLQDFKEQSFLSEGKSAVSDMCYTSGQNTMYADLPDTPGFSSDPSDIDLLSRGVTSYDAKSGGHKSDKSQFEARMGLMDGKRVSIVPSNRWEPPTPISDDDNDQFLIEERESPFRVDNHGIEVDEGVPAVAGKNPFMPDDGDVEPGGVDTDMDVKQDSPFMADPILAMEKSSLSNATNKSGGVLPPENMLLTERTLTDLSQVGPLPTFEQKDVIRNIDEVSNDSAFESAFSASEYEQSHFSEKVTVSHLDHTSCEHSQISEDVFDVELVSTLEYEGFDDDNDNVVDNACIEKSLKHDQYNTSVKANDESVNNINTNKNESMENAVDTDSNNFADDTDNLVKTDDVNKVDNGCMVNKTNSNIDAMTKKDVAMATKKLKRHLEVDMGITDAMTISTENSSSKEEEPGREIIVEITPRDMAGRPETDATFKQKLRDQDGFSTDRSTYRSPVTTRNNSRSDLPYEDILEEAEDTSDVIDVVQLRSEDDGGSESSSMSLETDEDDDTDDTEDVNDELIGISVDGEEDIDITKQTTVKHKHKKHPTVAKHKPGKEQLTEVAGRKKNRSKHGKETRIIVKPDKKHSEKSELENLMENTDIVDLQGEHVENKTKEAKAKVKEGTAKKRSRHAMEGKLSKTDTVKDKSVSKHEAIDKEENATEINHKIGSKEKVKEIRQKAEKEHKTRKKSKTIRAHSESSKSENEHGKSTVKLMNEGQTTINASETEADMQENSEDYTYEYAQRINELPTILEHSEMDNNVFQIGNNAKMVKSFQTFTDTESDAELQQLPVTNPEDMPSRMDSYVGTTIESSTATGDTNTDWTRTDSTATVSDASTADNTDAFKRVLQTFVLSSALVNSYNDQSTMDGTEYTPSESSHADTVVMETVVTKDPESSESPADVSASHMDGKLLAPENGDQAVMTGFTSPSDTTGSGAQNPIGISVDIVLHQATNPSSPQFATPVSTPFVDSSVALGGETVTPCNKSDIASSLALGETALGVSPIATPSNGPEIGSYVALRETSLDVEPLTAPANTPEVGSYMALGETCMDVIPLSTASAVQDFDVEKDSDGADDVKEFDEDKLGNDIGYVAVIDVEQETVVSKDINNDVMENFDIGTREDIGIIKGDVQDSFDNGIIPEDAGVKKDNKDKAVEDVEDKAGSLNDDMQSKLTLEDLDDGSSDDELSDTLPLSGVTSDSFIISGKVETNISPGSAGFTPKDPRLYNYYDQQEDRRSQEGSIHEEREKHGKLSGDESSFRHKSDISTVLTSGQDSGICRDASSEHSHDHERGLGKLEFRPGRRMRRDPGEFSLAHSTNDMHRYGKGYRLGTRLSPVKSSVTSPTASTPRLGSKTPTDWRKFFDLPNAVERRQMEQIKREMEQGKLKAHTLPPISYFAEDLPMLPGEAGTRLLQTVRVGEKMHTTGDGRHRIESVPGKLAVHTKDEEGGLSNFGIIQMQWTTGVPTVKDRTQPPRRIPQHRPQHITSQESYLVSLHPRFRDSTLTDDVNLPPLPLSMPTERINQFEWEHPLPPPPARESQTTLTRREHANYSKYYHLIKHKMHQYTSRKRERSINLPEVYVRQIRERTLSKKLGASSVRRNHTKISLGSGLNLPPIKLGQLVNMA